MVDIQRINEIYVSLPENGPYKKVQIKLNEMASLMPKTAYKFTYTTLKQIVDIRDEEIRRSGFSDVGPDLKFSPNVSSERKEFLKTKEETYLYANTKRILKKAWNESGKQGIKKAVKYIDQNNQKINSESSMKNIMKVADAVIRNKINTIFR